MVNLPAAWHVLLVWKELISSSHTDNPAELLACMLQVWYQHTEGHQPAANVLRQGSGADGMPSSVDMLSAMTGVVRSCRERVVGNAAAPCILAQAADKKQDQLVWLAGAALTLGCAAIAEEVLQQGLVLMQTAVQMYESAWCLDGCSITSAAQTGQLSSLTAACLLLLTLHRNDPAKGAPLQLARQLLHAAQQLLPSICDGAGSMSLTKQQHTLLMTGMAFAVQDQNELQQKQFLQEIVAHSYTTASHLHGIAQMCLAPKPWYTPAVANLAFGYMLRLASAAAKLNVGDLAVAVHGLLQHSTSHNVRLKVCQKLVDSLHQAACVEGYPRNEFLWLLTTCWNAAVDLHSSNPDIARQYLGVVQGLAQCAYEQHSQVAPEQQECSAEVADKCWQLLHSAHFKALSAALEKRPCLHAAETAQDDDAGLCSADTMDEDDSCNHRHDGKDTTPEHVADNNHKIKEDAVDTSIAPTSHISQLNPQHDVPVAMNSDEATGHKGVGNTGHMQQVAIGRQSSAGEPAMPPQEDGPLRVSVGVPRAIEDGSAHHTCRNTIDNSQAQSQSMLPMAMETDGAGHQLQQEGHTTDMAPPIASAIDGMPCSNDMPCCTAACSVSVIPDSMEVDAAEQQGYGTQKGGSMHVTASVGLPGGQTDTTLAGASQPMTNRDMQRMQLRTEDASVGRRYSGAGPSLQTFIAEHEHSHHINVCQATSGQQARLQHETGHIAAKHAEQQTAADNSQQSNKCEHSLRMHLHAAHGQRSTEGAVDDIHCDPMERHSAALAASQHADLQQHTTPASHQRPVVSITDTAAGKRSADHDADDATQGDISGIQAECTPATAQGNGSPETVHASSSVRDVSQRQAMAVVDNASGPGAVAAAGCKVQAQAAADTAPTSECVATAAVQRLSSAHSARNADRLVSRAETNMYSSGTAVAQLPEGAMEGSETLVKPSTDTHLMVRPLLDDDVLHLSLANSL